jgi:hypothetical protein
MLLNINKYNVNYLFHYNLTTYTCFSFDGLDKTMLSQWWIISTWKYTTYYKFFFCFCCIKPVLPIIKAEKCSLSINQLITRWLKLDYFFPIDKVTSENIKYSVLILHRIVGCLDFNTIRFNDNFKYIWQLTLASALMDWIKQCWASDGL